MSEVSPTVERHVPVLLARVLDLLDPALSAPGAVCLDATLGLGGHTEALLRRHPDLRIIGIDRDAQALELSRDRLRGFGARVEFVHAVYDRIDEVLADHGIDGVQGVLFDLGVSSMQLDEAHRGFAYAIDAPLDMRMDSSSAVTAADIVNGYPVADLTRILRVYGEERFAARVARRITERRAQRRFTSTTDLAEVIKAAIPAATRSTSAGHPAKRSFQALRIEVNAELDAVEAAIPSALSALRPTGRIVVLSYHSLEDRIVKSNFAQWAADHTPPGLPVPLASARPRLTVLTRGAERAREDEVERNPRAKSARLRAGERLDTGTVPSRPDRAVEAAMNPAVNPAKGTR